MRAARTLVADGADVNAKDDSEQSAYLIATSEIGDDPRLLELTLDAGADVDAKDSFNGTGLIRAAERGYVRIVRRLLTTTSTSITSTASAGPRCSRRSSSAKAAAPTPTPSACWSTPAPTSTSPTGKARRRSPTLAGGT